MMTSSAEHESIKRLTVWLPALFTILITTALFFSRRYDDNSLASWNVIFLSGGKPARFFIFLSSALLFASLISFSRISLPARSRPLFLFAASTAMAALCWSIPEVNIDASRYFEQAKHLELYGINFFFREWGKEIAAWTDLPAVPFLYGLIFRIFGEVRIFIQIFTAFLFGMTTILTWLIGKTLWDEDTGFIGGVLLLGMPYLLVMTPLMLVDVPTMFFLMLSVYLFLKTVQSGRSGWAAGAAVAIIFTVFCKYSALFLLSVLPLVFLIYYLEHPNQRRLIFRNTLVLFLFSFLTVGVVVVHAHDVVTEQLRLLLGYQKPGLGRWSESFVSTFLFQISPIISFAALVSLIVAGVRRDLKYLIIAWLPVLIFIFQIKRIRYTLPAFPMVALMAAYALTLLKDRRVVKAAVLCAVAATLALCFFAYIPYLKHLSSVNLQEAGAFLDTLDIDAVEVFPVPEQKYPINPAIAVPLLDLFTMKKIIFDYKPGTSSPDMDVNLTPFRFTWEYKNPGFYFPDAAAATGKKAVLVISGRTRETVPQAIKEKASAYKRTKQFITANPFYEYQTLVTIFW
jgi:4-amino-4-deoxy-L-arabinose transferase-like glycosyltransferase